MRNIYEVHSNSEDEIAFPALESKGALQNIGHSFRIDHKLEVNLFKKTSIILDEISELNGDGSNETRLKHYQLCLKLQDTCLSMHKVLSDHIHREEVEIFPLFRGCFSIEEEEKIVGHMLGRTRAKILQEMIPWLMGYLTFDEQNAMMSLWLKIARYTKFDEWLGDWWEGMTRYNLSSVEKGSRPSSLSLTADPLEIVSMYLLKDGSQTQKNEHHIKLGFDDFEQSRSCNVDDTKVACGGQCPSYRDPLKLTFGCEHYKRNCKLLAPCCDKLFTCIRCHDDLTDHSVDRKAITKMMCMKCLADIPLPLLQLVPTREGIGHWLLPLYEMQCFKGTSMWAFDAFSLFSGLHLFSLHLPKSLGDMQVYFGMLDALLAEEKLPEEYSGQTQDILCNDCEKRGTASFHWLYHKCPHCGSYNTRLL
ncbi:hypothetical protein BUALT_Bualt07G0053700 [Buddleja alternifolia]|uniref:CHY-type domain-containing protein n=1 Tax=Buddleja alternifolia TaxID=168488 RepID=A0AAV6XEX5_9LAMI|nr:hypothetical protein BUALT_Bualt07G0053700 [Buddleja alternifolia]